MRKAVAKHSYVKGATGMGKAKAHLRYIEHQKRDEREDKPREFFNDERDRVDRHEIYREIDEQSKYGVQMHKLILSPGVQDVDLRQYTKETMAELEKEKALNLTWYGVEHRNTDHDHIHVVVMAPDKDGHRVSFKHDDYKLMREVGDRYIEREKTYERYLDREMNLLLKHPDRQKEIEYERDKGDKHYERLMYGDPDDDRKRKDGDRERDRREHEELDKDLHKTNQRSYDYSKSSGARGRQWNIEQAGRLSDLHERYTRIEAKDRWEQLAERNPDIQDRAMKELADIERLEKDGQMERFKDVDIDHLMDGKDEHQRFIDRIIEQDERTFPEMLDKLRNPDIDLEKVKGRDDELSKLFGWEEQDKEPELEHLVEPREDKESDADKLLKYTREYSSEQEDKARESEEYQQRTGFAGGADQERGDDDAWQTFEADRQVSEQQEQQRDRDDIDRGDDFGR